MLDRSNSSGHLLSLLQIAHHPLPRQRRDADSAMSLPRTSIGAFTPFGLHSVQVDAVRRHASRATVADWNTTPTIAVILCNIQSFCALIFSMPETRPKPLAGTSSPTPRPLGVTQLLALSTLASGTQATRVHSFTAPCTCRCHFTVVDHRRLDPLVSPNTEPYYWS